jgi:hypothetical protein
MSEGWSKLATTSLVSALHVATNALWWQIGQIIIIIMDGTIWTNNYVWHHLEQQHFYNS